jgi:membrane associated rhomboid family serine protease
VTVALILVNVVAYLLATRSGHGGSFFGGPSSAVDFRYGAIPYELTHPGSHCALSATHAQRGAAQSVVCRGRTEAHGPATWETAFTSMFLQASFLPILLNALFLGLFGPAVEDAGGRLRFLCFYLLSGLIALGLQVAVAPNATEPILGASGALAAVLGGYALLYPRARVLSLLLVVFLVTIIEVPAVFLLAFWFAAQLWLGLEGLAGAGPLGSQGQGVAYLAHIGAFVFGVLAIRALVGRAPRDPPQPVY